jgi:hypothetical protein
MSNQQSNPLTVYKLDTAGRELWHYRGIELARGDTWVQLEAFFNRDDKDAGYIVFRRGDRYIEWFYSDRMYNIFEIHDVDDDHLKGWYCNICRPALITVHEFRCVVLALDVWITSTGKIEVLDEDEFEALGLTVREHDQAMQALTNLQILVERREYPFGSIPR